MLKIDKTFVIVEALKAAYNILNEENAEFKTSAVSGIKVLDDGNIDLFFDSKELSFFIKVDYDSSQIPERVQEIFSCPRVFENGIVNITAVRCDIKEEGLSISCNNVEINCSSLSKVKTAISNLVNKLFSKEFNQEISKCRLITGTFLLAYYQDNEYFKEKYHPDIFNAYGELVTWCVDDVKDCFAEGTDLMRDYEGFVLLDEEKGFHIEAEALYNESDYEPVENMF